MQAHQEPSPRRRRRTDPNARLCSHCGRSFRRTEHLERHVRTHTKEKPFICECGAAFSRRDLLRRHHRLSLHSETALEPAEPDHGVEPDDDVIHETGRVATSVPWLQQPDVDQNTLPFDRASCSVNVSIQRNAAVLGVASAQELLTPQRFNSSGMELDTQFYDFTSFLDGIGLPADWSPYFPNEVESPNPQVGNLRTGENTPDSRPGTPFNAWLPSAPTGSRLSRPHEDVRAPHSDAQPHRVSEELYARFRTCVSNVLDADFMCPSRHALTRYMASYFDGFHPHLPFIHSATWCMTDHSVELILGMAAIGAQYCFERRISERLYFAGKAAVLQRLGQKLDMFGMRTASCLNLQGTSTKRVDFNGSGQQICDWAKWEPMETVSALVLLLGYATWEMKTSLLQEAFTLQGLLAHVLRDVGLHEDGASGDESPADASDTQAAWRTWIRHEATRRAKLVSFTFLNIHSVAYDIFPVLRSNEVNLRLPCSTREWNAATAEEWQLARKQTKKQQLLFQDALPALLRNTDNVSPLDPIPTPLGNYVLLHGLLQRIYIVRDMSLPVRHSVTSLPAEEVVKLELGLRSWTSGWQQAPESSLNPNNESGPIPFTSSSLLGLAYVRIYLHLGPHRQLQSRDPLKIAEAISKAGKVERSTGLISALLYATHMLSIPVRLGVDRVAKSQAFFWSVRHSLAGLECAVLLSKWLSSLAESMEMTPTNDGEAKILHWVRCIVEEAFATVEFDDMEADPPLTDQNPAALSLAVLRIWAHFFKGNAQWPFINMIGHSLSKYQQLLQDMSGER